MKVIGDDLLEPNTILMLLLVADLFVHINCFSTFLQKKNWLYSNVAIKFEGLKEAFRKLLDEDGPLFTQLAREFLKRLLKWMESARRTRK